MSQSQAGSLRALKALVVTMGLVVVLGTALVAGVIIRRLYATPPAASNALPAAPVAVPATLTWPPSTAALRLPPGGKITAVSATAGFLAIAVSSQAGDQLWLLDPATGARYLAISSTP